MSHVPWLRVDLVNGVALLRYCCFSDAPSEQMKVCFMEGELAV